MSSSSSPYARPWATTGLVGPEGQDYQDSPLKPAPLRLPSKTTPSTPKLISRLSQSQRDGQSTPPVKRAQVRTTAPSLAGLVSKFEILEAMNTVDSGVPVLQYRTLDAMNPSKGESHPMDSPVGMLEAPGTHPVLAWKPSSGSVSPLLRGSHSARE